MKHPLNNDRLHDEFNGYYPGDLKDILDGSFSIFEADAMRAAYDLGRAEQLEQVEDAWCDALQEESECGIKSHSEKRAADMKRDYPVLARFGVVLDAMRSTQEDN